MIDDEAVHKLACDLSETIRAFDGYPSEISDYVKDTLGHLATPGVVHSAIAAGVATWHTEGQVDRLEAELVDLGVGDDVREALLSDLFDADLRPGVALADRFETIQALSAKHVRALPTAALVLRFERICEQITDQERAQAHLYAFIFEEVRRRGATIPSVKSTLH